MIKLERVQVMNLDNALRGMRNPMNSWHAADSYWTKDGFVIGDDDLRLARRLLKAGSDHRKYLRQIFVSIDITAPLYWWKEYDTYKVATTANSTSTMHRLHYQPITLADFSHERLSRTAREHLERTIELLEIARLEYVRNKTPQAWDDMIQLLPSSYNQLRTCTLTFENLLNMYHARKNHKLPEWREFCAWVAENLPYFAQICLEGEPWNAGK